MISKDMYKFLKAAPRYPQKTSFYKLHKEKKWEVNLYYSLLEEAIANQYIRYINHQPLSENEKIDLSFSISEAGQIALEEFKKDNYASVKSTWALIIAGLSLLVSVILGIVQLNN